MSPLIAKLVLAAVVAGTLGVAEAAPVKPHGKHPVKKPQVSADAPKPEKLVRAPGGVVVPQQARSSGMPGFMDDGASKRGQKP
jgi:hypothetical protein